MKKLCVIAALLVILVGTSSARVKDFALDRAQELYLQVDCKGPHSDPYTMGSAFPFGQHFVMTARHIECPDGQATLISANGQDWTVIAEDKNFPHPLFDVRVYVVPELLFVHYANFRAPLLGENSTGYGAALDIIATFGRVIQLRPEQGLILTSNIPIGGVSGSALVGDDMSIIGMSVFGYHDARVGGAVTGAVSGDVLKKLAASFPAYYESLQHPDNK